MKPLRSSFQFVLGLSLLVGLAWPGLAQQQRQRRVFTNEDVARATPRVPAAEPAAASTSGPGEEKAPSAEGAPADAVPPSTLISDPKAELKFILEFQGMLKNTGQFFYEKAELETKPDLKARWQSMATSMTTLFVEAQLIITELQKQIGEQPEAPAAPEPAGTPSPSPTPQ